MINCDCKCHCHCHCLSMINCDRATAIANALSTHTFMHPFLQSNGNTSPDLLRKKPYIEVQPRWPRKNRLAVVVVSTCAGATTTANTTARLSSTLGYRPLCSAYAATTTTTTSGPLKQFAARESSQRFGRHMHSPQPSERRGP